MSLLNLDFTIINDALSQYLEAIRNKETKVHIMTACFHFPDCNMHSAAQRNERFWKYFIIVAFKIILKTFYISLSLKPHEHSSAVLTVHTKQSRVKRLNRSSKKTNSYRHTDIASYYILHFWTSEEKPKQTSHKNVSKCHLLWNEKDKHHKVS